LFQKINIAETQSPRDMVVGRNVAKLFRSVLSGLPCAVHSHDLASLSQFILFRGLNVGRDIHGSVKIPIIRQNAVIGELRHDMIDEFRAFDDAEAGAPTSFTIA
jgi:hypothetical protein